VAKLDGYIVSVFGAAPLVGEKTLVRIEKVGRSAAQASLVNPPASPDAATPGNGRRRRRGRRGGRGRRRAGSGSPSS
jgi:ribonuclease G